MCGFLLRVDNVDCKEPSPVSCNKLKKLLLPSWVYPVEVLQPFLGSEGEQHILASSSSSSKQAGIKCFLCSPCLKMGIQVTQNDRRANAHHHKQVLCYFEPSSLFYGRFSVQKWPFSACFEAVFRTIVLKVQDDHQCANQLSQMQHCHLPPSSVLFFCLDLQLFFFQSSASFYCLGLYQISILIELVFVACPMLHFSQCALQHCCSKTARNHMHANVSSSPPV